MTNTELAISNIDFSNLRPDLLEILLIHYDTSTYSINNEFSKLAGIVGSKKITFTTLPEECSFTEFSNVLKLLTSAEVLTVLLGGKNVNFSSQHFESINFDAFSQSWIIVDPRLAFDEHYRKNLNLLIGEGNCKVKFLGHQTHLVPSSELDYLYKYTIEALRLGQIRQNIDRVEPWCRTTDHAIINLESLRKSDFKAKKDTNPGGFFYEEACKICQFIGASSHLKTIGFYGYDASKDPENHAAAVVAQLIWYLLDGYFNYREEKQIEKSKLIQYIVHASHRDLDINFWKSNETGRWWMEVPGHENYWISCTYDDYLEASKGEFSPRLISVLNQG
ncbi:MAG: hypothetical protein ABI844_00360 [Saprospiraceae bacterium]